MLKNSSKSVILPQNLRVGNYLCIDNLPSKIEGFSPNSEVYELNHYTNFQPLFKTDNLSKGNRYES